MGNQVLDIKLIDIATRSAYERDRAFLSTCGAKPPEAWGSLEEFERWELRDLVRAVMLDEAVGPHRLCGPGVEPRFVMPHPLKLAGSHPEQAHDRWASFRRVALAEKADYDASHAAYVAKYGDGSGPPEEASTA